jgi:hypothetical protein
VEKRLLALICKYNREFNGTFVITEDCRSKLENFISRLLKAQKQELKKKVEGMKKEGSFLFTKSNGSVDTLTQFAYNQALEDIIKLLEEV